MNKYILDSIKNNTKTVFLRLIPILRGESRNKERKEVKVMYGKNNRTNIKKGVDRVF